MNELIGQPAVMAGQAQRISKADKDAALTHADFIAGKAVLNATIQITRAATGKVEEYQIVGTPMKEED
jgi:transcription elongation GreA/GreB family factor